MQRKTPAWSPSLCGVVAAFRGGVAAGRSVQIWERKKKMREKAGAARERKAGAGAPHAHRDGEKLWSRPQFYIPQKYCSTIKTVVLNTEF
jgi:hypothetical protein